MQLLLWTAPHRTLHKCFSERMLSIMSAVLDKALVAATILAFPCSPSCYPNLKLVDADTLQALYGRVSTVTRPCKDGVQVIGTAFRVGIYTNEQGIERGLIMSATRVWVEDGRMVEASAFGEQLKLKASFPGYDYIFLEGPAGDSFRLLPERYTDAPGQEVMMLTYPQDLQNDVHERVEPVSAEDLNAVRPAIANGKMEQAPKQRMDTNANFMWPRDQSSKHDTPTSSSDGARQQRSVSASASGHQSAQRPASTSAVAVIKKPENLTAADTGNRRQLAVYVHAARIGDLLNRAGLSNLSGLYSSNAILSGAARQRAMMKRAASCIAGDDA
ncbi:hypothetical protein JKP88DRAFT_253867 [Tribonema minus]|uniref:Uncharacterized protein n=1 Tax=Tribonema minus TaxID=303371 RepID=A0A835Z6Q4_9STRA|nr:hypothetical protein JKP88DRAFT_253867 [Tribonema minus]